MQSVDLFHILATVFRLFFFLRDFSDVLTPNTLKSMGKLPVMLVDPYWPSASLVFQVMRDKKSGIKL